jgi:hypothetical protein
MIELLRVALKTIGRRPRSSSNGSAHRVSNPLEQALPTPPAPATDMSILRVGAQILTAMTFDHQTLFPMTSIGLFK